MAIDAFTAAGAKGIVIAALAPGGTTQEEKAALERAYDAGVVTMLSTRAGSGRVVESPGSWMRPKGIIPADNLIAQKARILLKLALTISSDPDEIRRIFATY